MNKLILVIYILLGLLHVFIVKSMLFLVVLVLVFEAVRLLAVYYRYKLPVVLLGVFSCIFITLNYFNTYIHNQYTNNQNNQLNQQINSYTSKYWVNQSTFVNLINKQQEITSNTTALPSFYIVGILVALIEFSLAYMICMGKAESQETNIKISKVALTKNTKENIQEEDQPWLFNNEPKTSAIDGMYFVDGKQVSKAWYYKNKKKGQLNG